MQGDTDRLEYIKQPHIIALILLGVLVFGGAIFTTIKFVRDADRRANMSTFDACQELITDTDLCRFAAANESLANRTYKNTTTTTDDTGTEITVTLFESVDRTGWQSTVNGKLVDGVFLIDADTYVLDQKDKIWAHFKDPEFTATDSLDELVAYDFTSEDSEDVIEFRENYRRVGEEACGNLWCLKYKLTSSESAGEIFLWIDNRDFLMQRYMSEIDGTKSETIYSYEPVTVMAPSPAKEVNEEQLNAILE